MLCAITIKKHILTISSCGITLLGSKKTRHGDLWEKGAIVYRNWLLKQLHKMAVYRSNYNALNWLNKETFSCVSICKDIGTKGVWKRV